MKITQDLPAPYKYAHWMCVLLNAKSLSYEDRLEASKKCLAEGKTIGIVNLFGLKQPIDNIGYQYRYDHVVAKAIRDHTPEVIIEGKEEKQVTPYPKIEETTPSGVPLSEVLKIIDEKLDLIEKDFPLLFSEYPHLKTMIKTKLEREAESEAFYDLPHVRKWVLDNIEKELFDFVKSEYLDSLRRINNLINLLERLGVWDFLPEELKNDVNKVFSHEDYIRHLIIPGYHNIRYVYYELIGAKHMIDILKRVSSIQNVETLRKMREKIEEGSFTEEDYETLKEILGKYAESYAKFIKQEHKFKLKLNDDMRRIIGDVGEIHIYPEPEFYTVAIAGITDDKTVLYLLEDDIGYFEGDIDYLVKKKLVISFPTFHIREDLDCDVLEITVKGGTGTLNACGLTEDVTLIPFNESYFEAYRKIHDMVYPPSTVSLPINIYRLLTLGSRFSNYRASFVEDNIVVSNSSKVVIDRSLAYSHGVSMNIKPEDYAIVSSDNLKRALLPSISRKTKDITITIEFQAEKPIVVHAPTATGRLTLAIAPAIEERPVVPLITQCYNYDGTTMALYYIITGFEYVFWDNDRIYGLDVSRTQAVKASVDCHIEGIHKLDHVVSEPDRLTERFVRIFDVLEIMDENGRKSIFGREYFEDFEPYEDIYKEIIATFNQLENLETVSLGEITTPFTEAKIEGDKLVFYDKNRKVKTLQIPRRALETLEGFTGYRLERETIRVVKELARKTGLIVTLAGPLLVLTAPSGRFQIVVAPHAW